MEIQIRIARPEDAGNIAEAVMTALGEDLCKKLAGDKTLNEVRNLFTSLAAEENTQYSYQNSLIAETGTGEVAGICIGYDGADLVSLRRQFFKKALEILGKDFQGMDDETSTDEFYIDTIAVKSEFRGKGIGKKLLTAQVRRVYETYNKPIGLLVDKENPVARHLYLSLGFKPAGERNFAGVPMEHLIFKDKIL